MQKKFKQAVEATPDIRECLKSGLQALGKHSAKIQLSSPCDGSVNIDECTIQRYPNGARWDYVFGYKGEAYFVEVHSAHTSEISPVLKKLAWLKDWLRANAPKLNLIKATTTPFIWIMSDKFAIQKGSSQFRKISQAGLMPIKKLKL